MRRCRPWLVVVGVIVLLAVQPHEANAAPTLHALDVAAGADHTCALLSDLTVRCWGNNDHGQLGMGTMTLQVEPQLVPGLTEVDQVVAGWNFNCARRRGAVRCWGRIEADAALLDPRRDLPGLRDVTQLAAGSIHACALHGNGKVSCWGRNREGQLGRGTTNAWGDVAPVPGLTGVVELALGGESSCARLASGEVRCWGRITDAGGRPTPVPGLTHARQLAVADAHACALLDDATVVCWGYNGNRRLGYVGPDSVRPVPVAGLTDAVQLTVSAGTGCVTRKDGSVWCWGNSEDYMLPTGTRPHDEPSPAAPVVELSDVDEVQLPNSVSGYLCARHRDGTVVCGGERYLSPLTSATPRFRPVAGLSSIHALAIGFRHLCALRDDQRVGCWGETGDGETGQPLPRPSPPVTVHGLTAVHGQLLAGYGQSCVFGTTGTATEPGLYCWGAWRAVPERVEVPAALGRVVEIALSADTCLRTDQARVQCFSNSWLDSWRGSSYMENRPTFPPTGVVAPTALDVAEQVACAIQADGTVACWTRRRPAVVVEGVAGAQAISLNSDGDGCAIMTGDRVACWSLMRDDDSYATTAAVPVPALQGARSLAIDTAGGCALMDAGVLRCWNGAVPDRKHPARTQLTGVTKVVARDGHSCALRNGGELWCWGRNDHAQLGTGQPSPPRATPVRVSFPP